MKVTLVRLRLGGWGRVSLCRRLGERRGDVIGASLLGKDRGPILERVNLSNCVRWQRSGNRQHAQARENVYAHLSSSPES